MGSDNTAHSSTRCPPPPFTLLKLALVYLSADHLHLVPRTARIRDLLLEKNINKS
jgi:hypothetical protein